jgi:KDO2-lipid IV(A) lauroyltransferase
MHFGAIELPVIVVSHAVGHAVTAPMEEVSDPGLAHWFTVSRSRVGVRVVSLSNARGALLRALRRGESVGLVADRDITGSGMMVPFFGHPTPIPVGPALLALETGAPVYVASARRTKGGRYAGKLIHIAPPAGGSRRERVTAFTVAIAAAFETTLADAPEQWWGAFHAFWPDIALDAAAAPRDPATP